MRHVNVNNGSRSTLRNPFQQSNITPQQYVEQLQDAVVVDVITNESHPEYAMDGYNVGAIKIRLLKTDYFRDDADLHWAFPLSTNVTDYPLIGETVLVVPALNRIYWTNRINMTNYSTVHPAKKVNQEMQPAVSGKQQNSQRKLAETNPNKGVVDTEKYGNEFEEPTNVWRLRSSEGDIIHQGRFGQSIRLGASRKSDPEFVASKKDQSPNLLIVVGQDPEAKPTADTPAGLIRENINNDLSSIWMVADQQIPLDYATIDNREIHRKSIRDFPDLLEGNQIVINSDRIVLNTKTDKIMAFSKNGIHFVTSKTFSVDAGGDYFSYIAKDRKIEIIGNNNQNIGGNFKFWIAGNQIIDIQGNETVKVTGNYIQHAKNIDLQANKINLGGPGGQPMVLGNVLVDIINMIIDAHVSNAGAHVMTSMGPGTLNGGVVAALQAIRAKYPQLLSKSNFVKLQNPAPQAAAGKVAVH